MLVLTRKPQEKIRIGDNIVITVLRTKGKAVRLGIEAPNDISVLRGELAFDDSPVKSSTVKSNTETEHNTEGAKMSGGSMPNVHFDRVSRDRRTTVVAPLVADGGPLRAMLNSRVVAR